MNLSRSVFAAGLTCVICGCGTINNTVGISYGGGGSGSKNDPYRNYVYGGVKCDAEMSRAAFTTKEDFPANLIVGILYAADLPLSAVCDTLYLPLAIPGDIQLRRARELQWANFDEHGDRIPADVATTKNGPESN